MKKLVFALVVCALPLSAQESSVVVDKAAVGGALEAGFAAAFRAKSGLTGNAGIWIQGGDPNQPGGEKPALVWQGAADGLINGMIDSGGGIILNKWLIVSGDFSAIRSADGIDIGNYGASGVPGVPAMLQLVSDIPGPNVISKLQTMPDSIHALGVTRTNDYQYSIEHDGSLWWGAGPLRATRDASIGRGGEGIVETGPGGAHSLRTASVRFSGVAAPACDAATAGVTWYAPGGAGVSDHINVCLKTSAGGYAVVSLAAAP